MTQWLFDPPPRASLPVCGRRERFAVRRILCVGRNYAAHAREMGADPERDAPFFFSKPADAVVADGADVSYPPATHELHHEVELVCALGPGPMIVGWAVGVDLTRRDLQAKAKAEGRPWDAAKGFDQSAPCGALRLGATPAEDAAMTLSVAGVLKQSARLCQMIWKPAEILDQAARLWVLAPGDLIFTGTPEGVGPLARGDGVEARIEGLPPLDFVVR